MQVNETSAVLREKAAELDQSYHPETYVGQSPIKVNKLGHFVYEVSNIERSVKFWSEVMGFVETDRNAHGMVFFRCGADQPRVEGIATERVQEALDYNR